MYLRRDVFLWGFIGGTWNLLQTEQNILSDNHLQRAALMISAAQSGPRPTL